MLVELSARTEHYLKIGLEHGLFSAVGGCLREENVLPGLKECSEFVHAL